MSIVSLDLSGLECPQPSIRTKRYLRTAVVGSEFEVISTDPLSELDIPFLLQQLGHELIQMTSVGGRHTFRIRVTDAGASEESWPQTL